ncbi:unnamed protein product [Didymodactylos carnosus]|uniref:LRAT domain-containing protein n=1 Tax=Didymodactylos carnosus TaxID=1234261 RepID=A0A814BDU7_9BILA|nr:unnamed protein product [Didymodactylos carnosus]CAF3704256.1 unnamed protein product [Didymodactylos carnosus]
MTSLELFDKQNRIQRRPELGDMIEFNRKRYCHWGIYVGDGKVIHRWGEGINKLLSNPQAIKVNNLLTFSGNVLFNNVARIEERTLTNNDNICINNYLDHELRYILLF